MADLESDPRLRPYLNPAYWDGHMIADGQPTPLDPESFTGPAFGATARFAKRALRDRLALMHTHLPVQVYRNGDTFDPEEWAIGTVALFDREVLRTRKGRSFDPAAYTSLEVPARPTDLRLHLRYDASGTVSYADDALDITYWRTMEWGVVSPTKEGRKAFQRVSTTMAGIVAPGRIAAGPFLPQTVPINVGATRHTIYGDDRLNRTNILHICMVGSGEEQKKRASIFAFFGRLATGDV